jgi:hypothetical protein
MHCCDYKDYRLGQRKTTPHALSFASLSVTNEVPIHTGQYVEMMQVHPTRLDDWRLSHRTKGYERERELN